MSSTPESVKLVPLPPFKPDLYQRAWQSIPHPTLPLLATAHQKSVTVFSLTTLSAHSALTNGHDRSVRSTTWKPNLAPHKLCLVTGSFDSTAGLWRWTDDENNHNSNLEVEVTNSSDNDEKDDEKDWELIIILDGQDSEIKSVAFSPTGQFLATCSRDKSVWIWEDVGAREDDDEWETVAVLSEHEGDVKAVAWCPETNRVGRRGGGGGRYGSDVLASASYDDTVRVWREEGEQEWVCVAVLEGHGGTVWGVQWEPKPRGTAFPRLMTWSADKTIRIWTLKEEDEEEEERTQHAWGGGGGLGGIPNTMRRSLKEEWECTAVLPQAHTRDIYSATWSPETGMVASTGSDGVIAVYAESTTSEAGPNGTVEDEAAAELDGDVPMTNGHAEEKPQESKKWKVVSTTSAAHGPYEVNHITWCKRYDQGCPPERRGIEEMLVTTGDDGIVRPWQVIQS
ncbi:WD40 repeat-like protein [Annulohypoxylon truncatum]|uniref:WD40 repeat-like protein n=1 Tax=Annulohypoxylon truncatum TaxID=327061 RepID=UPI0020084352|nr:WD40 repeat-like protein [Annulohypoxylon truncatum]KAI1210522.1 WD40 repeat-like protein [Annulohypoxylon truncatum]